MSDCTQDGFVKLETQTFVSCFSSLKYLRLSAVASSSKEAIAKAHCFAWRSYSRSLNGSQDNDQRTVTTPCSTFRWQRAYTDTQTHRHTDTQTHRHTDTHTHALGGVEVDWVQLQKRKHRLKVASKRVRWSGACAHHIWHVAFEERIAFEDLRLACTRCNRGAHV